ncbi:sulfur carrier protein ThiS [Pseudomonadota bacterium]
MEIIVNGEPRDVAESFTVTNLLQELELIGRRLAVEVNMEIVPRSQHEQRQLKAGDKIEIVHAIGGG